MATYYQYAVEIMIENNLIDIKKHFNLIGSASQVDLQSIIIGNKSKHQIL